MSSWFGSSGTCRLKTRQEEQMQLAQALEAQLQEKLASQSGEMKILSEEAAALRDELKTVAEETQVRFSLGVFWFSGPCVLYISCWCARCGGHGRVLASCVGECRLRFWPCCLWRQTAEEENIIMNDRRITTVRFRHPVDVFGQMFGCVVGSCRRGRQRAIRSRSCGGIEQARHGDEGKGGIRPCS